MFFDRPESGEGAVLVHIDFPEGEEREDPREFEELVRSAGGAALALITGSRKAPDPKTYIGKGKLEEVREAVEFCEAELVLFNHALSPSQQRNLEAALECRVIDRTGLILDIFALRARTYEGKLQVELAQLQYQATRLVHGWSHLDRQKGGIGMRGTGETQLESDRRLLKDREKLIYKRLQKVQTQRDQSRRARKRSDIPTVSLVGYTNAGKSTLFNALTNAEVYAADQLFATLDPTLRRLPVQGLGEVVLVDTVGFIRHLPHKLVEAFKATLQETREADLLLHVIDCADDDRALNMEQVEIVLDEIDSLDRPTLQVFNKADLLPGQRARIDRDESGMPWRVWVSAKTGDGLELINQVIGEILTSNLFEQSIELSPKDGQLRALLYDHGAVLNETVDENGQFVLDVRIEKEDMLKILSRAGIPAERYIPQEKEFWQ
ncbi:ribosome rescue GTPase HflX [Bermanella sp. WJH001]|uniref:ribosome rescue GTPase HflX n=1 Tax=Bermanella sp. WJH001 TaxID=3048005 RepID=UPI0024BE8789|nr:ribosome rescue GTPase HflX [Bermanella sp. WJH001]MDJ1538556.1 GTPase HflX [Bermanella sp. WJH001]